MPVRLLWNAIAVPSGDQAGLVSGTWFVVNLVNGVPSGFIV
ncbi:MAG: hypothetical protein ACXVZN_07350 [Gaiellaceae bacterium]